MAERGMSADAPTLRRLVSSNETTCRPWYSTLFSQVVGIAGITDTQQWRGEKRDSVSDLLTSRDSSGDNPQILVPFAPDSDTSREALDGFP
jgi:hypothetical protein